MHFTAGVRCTYPQQRPPRSTRCPGTSSRTTEAESGPRGQRGDWPDTSVTRQNANRQIWRLIYWTSRKVAGRKVQGGISVITKAWNYCIPRYLCAQVGTYIVSMRRTLPVLLADSGVILVVRSDVPRYVGKYCPCPAHMLEGISCDG